MIINLPLYGTVTMPDPNDFVDNNTPEGDVVSNLKAGKEGVGGLSTEEAEEVYKKAAKQHFETNLQPQKTHKKNKSNDNLIKKNIKIIPQIGSIEDSDELTIDY